MHSELPQSKPNFATGKAPKFMSSMSQEIPSLVDLCIRHGTRIHEFCFAVKTACTNLEEESGFIDLAWKRCKEQMLFLSNISTKNVFDAQYLLLQKIHVRIFQARLDNAMEDIGTMFKMESVRGPNGQFEDKMMPTAFRTASAKSNLDKLNNALESWQHLCDPLWYLMLKNNRPSVRAVLRENPMLRSLNSITVVRSNARDPAQIIETGRSLKLEAADLKKMETSPIAFSTAQMAVARRSSGKMSTYILDRLHEDRGGDGRARDIAEMCKRLQHDEPETFSLLQCKGYVEDQSGAPTEREETYYTTVFRLPPKHFSPRSLRSWLIGGSPPASLSYRFALATQSARAVAYIHILGFVHKNIRPETILCFEKVNIDVPSVFMIGFDLFRNGDDKLSLRKDDGVEKLVYRHWTRQGVAPESDYIMQYDIYSLGVCMLEIGLWRSFVDFSTVNQTYRLSGMFAPHQPSEKGAREHIAEIAKHGYIQLCRTELRRVMGTKYAEIVETCLTCLNQDNADFGDPKEFEDQEGIRVGYRYIEKVLHRLENLSV